MNLSPAQKKVIERLGDGEILRMSSWGRVYIYLGMARVNRATFDSITNSGLISREPGQDQFHLTPKGQQLYEDMKKK